MKAGSRCAEGLIVWEDRWKIPKKTSKASGEGLRPIIGHIGKKKGEGFPHPRKAGSKRS